MSRHVRKYWTKEEDDILINAIKIEGSKHWKLIANKYLHSRTAKQCRERWHLKLNPENNKEKWTIQEDRDLLYYHQMYGNKWADIANYLPGRSSISIKNRCNLLAGRIQIIPSMKNYSNNQKSNQNSVSKDNSSSNSSGISASIEQSDNNSEVDFYTISSLNSNPTLNPIQAAESKNPQKVQVFPLLDPGFIFPSRNIFLNVPWES